MLIVFIGSLVCYPALLPEKFFGKSSSNKTAFFSVLGYLFVNDKNLIVTSHFLLSSYNCQNPHYTQQINYQ